MTFLDTYPLDWTDPQLRELHGALTASFYRSSIIEQIVLRSGISPGEIGWEQPARTVWHDAMRVASDRRLLPELLAAAVERAPAFESRLEELLAPRPAISVTPSASQPDVLAPTDPRWKGFSDDGRERQIVEGDETLLDVSFLERGLQRAAAVCRLTVSMPSGIYLGTAFRISPTHLLTNHHVLFDWNDGEAEALSVTAAFGLELDLQGRLRQATELPGDVSTITGERDHDFSLIETTEPMPEDAPVLSLRPRKAIEIDDRVVIVQHPNGLPKKIALAHNLVRYVDDDIVQYWTDTDGGSSGSPVFNESWEVVGLHHQYVRSPFDDGRAFRNQGRSIGRVAERIDALGIDLAAV